jgi:hypothetical protein
MERQSFVDDIWEYKVKDVFARPRLTQSSLCRAVVWCDVNLVGVHSGTESVPRRKSIMWVVPHRYLSSWVFLVMKQKLKSYFTNSNLNFTIFWLKIIPLYCQNWDFCGYEWLYVKLKSINLLTFCLVIVKSIKNKVSHTVVSVPLLVRQPLFTGTRNYQTFFICKKIWI